jgi:hypothetical protein
MSITEGEIHQSSTSTNELVAALPLGIETLLSSDFTTARIWLGWPLMPVGD